jgi:hypothetical protein
MPATPGSDSINLVLVHGGFVDGSGWEAVSYLVATEDRMIPPQAQRLMAQRAGATVVESSGSHAIYVSRPAVVAELIQRAVKECAAGAHAS